MADKKLSFNITAEDDASKVFSKLASTAKKEMGKVDESLDDTRTAGKQMADALGAVFEQLDAELTESKAAADKLAAALGPELAPKVDTSKMIAEFQRAGLSIDEIETEVDELAAAIRKADDVTLRHFTGEADKTADSLDRVRDSGDQSRSVMANMVGNSVQDVSALGGVAGTAGMALGQLGEYAAEGNIKLGELVKLAGPMVLVGAAVAGVTGHMKEQARIKAFETEKVDSWAEAIRGGGDAIRTMTENLREAGEIKVLDILGDEQDLTPKLAAAGVSVEQWTQLVSGSKEELDTWALASVAAGGDVEALKVVVEAAQREQKLYAEGAAQAAIQDKVFSSTTEALAEKLSLVGVEIGKVGVAAEVAHSPVAALMAAQQSAAEAAELHAEALELETARLEGMMAATRAMVDAGFAIRPAPR